MPSEKTLSVVPNPFLVLDHEGHPCATMPFDPDHAAGSRRWVGASIDLTRTVMLKSKSDQRATMKVGGRQTQVYVNAAQAQRTHWAYDLEPQVALDIPYYRAAVADGSLFAADAATAAKCGVEFKAPAALLGAAAKGAIAEWEGNFGEGPPVAEWAPNLRALVASPAPALIAPVPALAKRASSEGVAS